MGATFTNIHIRKKVGADEMLESVGARFLDEGYVKAEKDAADITIAVFEPEDGEWTSVYSDAFEGDMDKPREIAFELSRAYGADAFVNGCLDSDYVCLNLINADEEIDIWAGAGLAEEYGIETSDDFSMWECRVDDVEAFKAAAEAEYVFAEDSFDAFGPMLHIPAEQSVAYYDLLDDSRLKGNVRYLYLALPSKTKNAPPRLELAVRPLSILEPGKASVLSVVNKGGESRGLGVFFLAPGIGPGEVRFADVRLIRYQKGAAGERETAELTFDRVRLPNGKIALFAKNENILLPEGPSEQLPGAVRVKKMYERGISIVFTPIGKARGFFEISAVFVPLANPSGQCSWNCWGTFATKSEYFMKCRIPEKMKDYDTDEPFGARDPKIDVRRVEF